MSDIAELEQRIAVAMDRIGQALQGFDPRAGADDAALAAAEAAGAEKARAEADVEIAGLKEALEAEQTANAQLRERVAAVKAKKDQLQERLSALETAEAELQHRRAADRAELDDLIAALSPLVKEAS